MAEDLLETYLRQLIEAHARSSEVTVAWQGGEPVDVWFRPQVEALPRLGGLQQVGHPIARTVWRPAGSAGLPILGHRPGVTVSPFGRI